MELLKTVLQAQQWQQQQAGKTIGFVPTMGALHKGHLSLVQRACKENDAVVASIFVNPTQFDDKTDLAHYPRTLDADLTLLNTTACTAVFAPTVAEIYPVPDERVFDFGSLDKIMEGKCRSGHFNGVGQVVSRLFAILPAVRRAYFGEKDFQQLAIVRYLVRQLGIPVEIAGCPIVREADGLAMSSRNALLTPEQRAAAPLIARTLFAAVDMVCTHSIENIRQFVIARINANPLMQAEYFEIVNAASLQPVFSWDEECTKQGCVAVRVGSIRLIDNIRLG
jgi:pantoate--beta-alanine ligase